MIMAWDLSVKVRGDLEGKPPWEVRPSDLLPWLRTVAILLQICLIAMMMCFMCPL